MNRFFIVLFLSLLAWPSIPCAQEAEPERTPSELGESIVIALPNLPSETEPLPDGAAIPSEATPAPVEAAAANGDDASTSLQDLLDALGEGPERPDLSSLGVISEIRPDPSIDNVSIQAPFMPLDQLLEEYSRITGRFLLRQATIDGAPEELYVVFEELSPQEALDYLNSTLALNGIAVLPVGDKFLRVETAENAPKTGQPFNAVAPSAISETGQFMRKAVQLEHALASEIAEVLFQFASASAGQSAVTAVDSNNVLILQDYAPNVKRMLEMVEKIDVQIPLNIDMELIPVRFALAEEIGQILGSLTPSGAVSVGGGGARSGLRSRSTSSVGGGVGGNNRNRAGAQGGVNNTTANRSQFQQNIQSIVNRAAAGEFQILGETRIIPDTRTNSILVFAQKRDLEMIKKIVEQIDIVQSQVLIEAVIMEVSISEDEDFGVSYVSRPQTEGGVTGVGGVINNPGVNDIFLDPRSFATGANANTLSGLPSGLSYFSQLGTDLNVAVAAIQRNSKGTILQRPRIQTFHAKEARIFIGERQPFVGSSFFGVSTASSSQIDYLDIGVELLILPLINQEGLVVMEIVQNIAGVTEFRQIDGNDIPVTNEKQAEASIAVRSGETVLLGGFIERQQTNSESGVPVLKDIPLLGRLFKSTSRIDDTNEIVVLIKPTVLPTPQIAEEVAASELEKLMGIRTSQLEFEILDEKYRRVLNAKIDELERLRRRRGDTTVDTETEIPEL